MGCSKNLVDSESLMRQFEAAGYHCSHDPKHIADVAEVDYQIIVAINVATLGEPYLFGASLACLFNRIHHVLSA